MATFLRTWSYRYQSLYDTISRLAALGVGGEKRFRLLASQDIPQNQETKVLDLCCGAGQTTKYLVDKSSDVTGLDVSPVALERAAKRVPQAKYVEALAQKLPFADNQFDLVHTSVALHEMTPLECQEIFSEVYRVLKPGGIFAFIDFHRPHNWLFWPGLAMFMWLFETETAWQFLNIDLVETLTTHGFKLKSLNLYLGGSLQVIQATK